MKSPLFTRRWWRAFTELLASMRFAVALLALVGIVAAIGTVVPQGAGLGAYINKFGAFWGVLFVRLGLGQVYSAWWFLLILALLVASTTLCLVRHTPKHWADMRSMKENIRPRALHAFGLRAQARLAAPPAEAAGRLSTALAARRWRVRQTPHEGEGVMLAARAGASNRLGYVLTHGAIVLIALGGLLDGEMFTRAAMLLGGKSVYTGGGQVADVPAEHRLSAGNPAFRGNMMVAEGERDSTLILTRPDGVLLQDLPFEVELKKFHLEHYDNGTPKLYASELVLHDKKSGESVERRIEVNHPTSWHGITIYQSGFDDGGSVLDIHSVPLNGSRQAPDMRARIGEVRTLTSGEETLTLELLELRPQNIEPRAAQTAEAAASAAAAAQSKVAKMTGEDMMDLGPSLRYRLRDAAGQAREFHSYMRAADLGGETPVFLLGVRASPAQPFSYLRVPPDENGEMEGFVRLLAALHDDDLRQQAAKRYAEGATTSKQVQEQLADSAHRALSLFAGAEMVQGMPVAGLPAISAFIESAVPEPEREQAAQVLLRLLGGCLTHLNTLAREAEKLPPLPDSDATSAFMTQAMLALSEAPLYGAPLALTLRGFEQRHASVLQMTRSPGVWLVYPGCLLLVAGVMLMLYVRDRRLWLWLQADGSGTLATLAMSARRRTAESEREFERLRAQLLPPAPPSQEETP